MEFPKHFFEDEVRDGFYVPAMMKRAWAAQLEVLCDIDKVCKKYNLHYYADWGTLIGAIRHGGFIPWDDDMDISMLRKDYDTFARVALDELPEGYGILNFGHSDDGDFKCDDYLIRVYNTNRIRVDQAFLDKFHGFPYAAGMDIFPMDYIPPDEEEDKMLCEQVAVLSSLALMIEKGDTEEEESYLRQLEDTYDIKIDRTKPIRRQIYLLSEELCRAYTGEDSKYITTISSRTRWDYKIPKKYYEKPVPVPFETGQIAVPVCYDAALRCKYCDYMKPGHVGGSHEYPFYKKQARIFEEKNKPLFQSYSFSEKELERARGDQKGSLKTYAGEMLKLFMAAGGGIIDAIGQGNGPLAAELLENCQDGAIALGNKIEEIKGEGLTSVTALEQYCEVLYNIYEAVIQNNMADVDSVSRMLAQILLQLENHLKKDVLMKKVVVFLPFKASMWDSLESVWKAAASDPDCDAYVVPIPYYDKSFSGAMEEMHYEGDLFPDDVPITDYNTFDFGLHRPDMIFIHNPYDGYNLSTSVHPFFYSKELQKYTERLVYIPYFVLDEMEDDDELAIASMEAYCTMPGVVHADTVVVQSEKTRLAYIKKLTEFAGENTRPVWEKKILGIGSPKRDRDSEERENALIPAEWERVLRRPDGTKKKTILYHTTAPALVEHGEAMIAKIKSVLSLLKEKQETIAFIWRPDLAGKELVETMKQGLWESLDAIMEDFQKEGWGILDETSDYGLSIRLCDAYYGDPHSSIRLCARAGLPTMIQNADVLQYQYVLDDAAGEASVYQELKEKTVYETKEKSVAQLEHYLCNRMEQTDRKQGEKTIGAMIYEALNES